MTAVITGWSTVSPYGIGQEAFSTGLAAGPLPTVATVDAAEPGAHLVEGFDIRAVLGRMATRSWPGVTPLAVRGGGDVRPRPAAAGAVGDGLGTALVLGTTTGSAESMMNFTRTSLEAEKPFYVDPALMPNAVMNCAAGQCAIWYQLKGPNTTIAGGRAAGLLALGYARRLLTAGRADRVLCGCAEEFSRARSWLEHHSRGEAPAVPLTEGSAMLLVEPAGAVGPGRTPLAEILAVESRVDVDGDVKAAVGACVEAALRGLDQAQVWAAVGSDAAVPVLAERFGAACSRVPIVPGDAGAVTAGFQIAAVLATAATEPAATGRLAVLTVAEPDGTVACAVLRLLEAAR